MVLAFFSLADNVGEIKAQIEETQARTEDFKFENGMSLPIHLITYIERPRLQWVLYYYRTNKKKELADQGKVPAFP